MSEPSGTNRSTPATISDVLAEIEPSDRYEYGEEFARGGMGAIHSAEDKALDREVAVKMILAADASPRELARFVNEARITGRLEHPGIVPVHDIGIDALGDPFYAMKLVRGRDLESILSKLKKGDSETRAEFPLRRLLGIFLRVCDAIAYAHENGVIHRDIKPSNIRVGDFGEVLVMDWGLAKTSSPEMLEGVQDGERQQETIGDGFPSKLSFETLQGEVMGSVGYMAPEQAMGEFESLDERVDIYSLGAVLYQILTLRPPIDLNPDESFKSTVERVNAGTIPDPAESDGSFHHLPGNGVPEPLAKVAMKALAASRERRYASVQEIQSEIDAWLGGYATMVEEAGWWRQARLLVQRHRVASTAALIILGMLFGGAVFMTHQRNLAVEALSDYERVESEKQEQARASAPAYLKSALALEQQGEFEDALAAVSQTLELDPGLIEAWRTRCFLLVQADRFDEALESLNELMDRVSTDQSDNDQRLAGLLTSLVEEKEDLSESEARGRWMELAKLASEVGMASTAVEMLKRWEHPEIETYRQGLPIWRAKLDREWPGAGAQLIITSRSGLEIRLGSEFRPLITSLEPLRNIPLTWVNLRGLQVTSLEPLQGMPLQGFEAIETDVKSLDGLEESPLKHVLIKKESESLSSGFTRALHGKLLEKAQFIAHEVDTSEFDQIQFRELNIRYKVTSLGFLENQPHLEHLVLDTLYRDRNLEAIFHCSQLQTLESMPVFHGILSKFWGVLEDESLPLEDRMEKARLMLESWEAKAKSPALEEFRSSLALLKFFLERKTREDSVALPEESKPLLRQVGDRWFARILYSPIGLREDAEVALATLDVPLASIHNEEEYEAAVSLTKDVDILMQERYLTGLLRIGARRLKADPGAEWYWSDGTPWDYEKFLPGEESRSQAKFGPAWQIGMTVWGGGWRSADLDRSSGLLLQFPASWVKAP